MKRLLFITICILLNSYEIYTVNRMSKEEIQALTIPEIQALTIEDIEDFDSIETFLKELSIAQTKALSPDIIGDLSLDIQYFRPDQIGAFTPEQTKSITADQILLLDKAQIQQVSFAQLPTETLRTLILNPTGGKLTNLTSNQFQKLSPDQIILLLPELTIEQVNFISDKQRALFSPSQKRDFDVKVADIKFNYQQQQKRRAYEKQVDRQRREAEAQQRTEEDRWFEQHKEIVLQSIQEFFQNVSLKDFEKITFNQDLLQTIIGQFPELETLDRTIAQEKFTDLTNALLGRYRGTRDWVRNLRDKNNIKNDILEIKRQNSTASTEEIFTILKDKNISKLRDALNDPLMLSNKIEAVIKGWIANPESATSLAKTNEPKAKVDHRNDHEQREEWIRSNRINIENAIYTYFKDQNPPFSHIPYLLPLSTSPDMQYLPQRLEQYLKDLFPILSNATNLSSSHEILDMMRNLKIKNDNSDLWIQQHRQDIQQRARNYFRTLDIGQDYQRVRPTDAYLAILEELNLSHITAQEMLIREKIDSTVLQICNETYQVLQQQKSISKAFELANSLSRMRK